MKKVALFLFVLIIFQSFTSQAESHKIKAEVKSVTLFLESAQVTRKANIQVSSGEEEIVFQNLSPFIDAKSIQA